MKIILTLIFLLLGPLSAKELTSFKLPSYSNQKEFSYTNGKKTLINFWATWCTACIQEIPELEQLKKENPKVDFLAVNAGESKKKIKKFLKKHGFSYHVLMDKDKKMSKGLGVLSLPQTFVIDSKGNIIYHSDKPPKKL